MMSSVEETHPFRTELSNVQALLQVPTEENHVEQISPVRLSPLSQLQELVSLL